MGSACSTEAHPDTANNHKATRRQRRTTHPADAAKTASAAATATATATANKSGTRSTDDADVYRLPSADAPAFNPFAPGPLSQSESHSHARSAPAVTPSSMSSTAATYAKNRSPATSHSRPPRFNHSTGGGGFMSATDFFRPPHDSGADTAATAV